MKLDSLTDSTAFFVGANGTFRKIKCAHGPAFTLGELQGAVDGYITTCSIPDHPRFMIVCNEDGLPRGLPDNLAASLLAGRRLVGDVVVMRRTAFA